MAKIYSGADKLIGNTPLMELTHIEEEFGLKAKVIAKLEYLNPTGSIKDRTALSMIEDAEKSGKIKKGSVIIEPTSGNTGIGIASVGTAKGYKVIIVMPDTMSVERQILIKAYGAEIVLSDGKLGMKGAIDKANEIAKEQNGIVLGQFDNPANPKIHYETTGKEIWEDTDGNVDIVVAGIGTGGTITGIAKFLKEKNKNIEIVGVEPATSPLITKGVFGAHQIQGIGANFIPSILDLKLIDKVVTCENEDAFTYGKLIGKKEGVLVGISSGCALSVAVELAKKNENKGKNIIVILPDSGDRYLSTKLFKD